MRMEYNDLQAKLYILCGRAAFRLHYEAWLARNESGLAMKQLLNNRDTDKQNAASKEDAT